MHGYAQDIFREMDALADPLVTHIARNYGAGVRQEYGYRMVIQDSDTLRAPSGFTESCISYAVLRTCTGSSQGRT